MKEITRVLRPFERTFFGVRVLASKEQESNNIPVLFRNTFIIVFRKINVLVCFVCKRIMYLTNYLFG